MEEGAPDRVPPKVSWGASQGLTGPLPVFQSSSGCCSPVVVMLRMRMPATRPVSTHKGPGLGPEAAPGSVDATGAGVGADKDAAAGEDSGSGSGSGAGEGGPADAAAAAAAEVDVEVEGRGSITKPGVYPDCGARGDCEGTASTEETEDTLGGSWAHVSRWSKLGPVRATEPTLDDIPLLPTEPAPAGTSLVPQGSVPSEKEDACLSPGASGSPKWPLTVAVVAAATAPEPEPAAAAGARGPTHGRCRLEWAGSGPGRSGALGDMDDTGSVR